MLGMTLVRREKPLAGGQVRAVATGVVLALLVGAVLLAATGSDPIEVYSKMFTSSFGSQRGLSTTLNRAVPLGLAGLAVAIAASMGLWNIGAEGQIIAGAIGAAWVARLGPDLPGPVLIPLMLVGAVLGGGFLALVPAFARARLGVNEIITTLMLNEVAIRIVRYLVNGPWKDPEGNNFPIAPRLPEQARLPVSRTASVPRTSQHRFADGGGRARPVRLLLARSTWGYELRIAGSSAKAAEYVGISLKAKILTVLVISGAVAGLAGGIELSGSSNRLVEGVADGWGFAGIIVAALALMRPSGVAAVAVAFGAVQVGGLAIQGPGVPSSISDILQALILFGALIAGVFTNYRVVRAT